MDTKKLSDDIRFILNLPPINEGVEWFSNENWFDVIAEIVLVRQTPIEAVTSAVVALKMLLFEDSIPEQLLSSKITEKTKWPYADCQIRRSGKSVLNSFNLHIENLGKEPQEIRFCDLSPSAFGNIVSLERYYNRSNRFFDAIHFLAPTEEQWNKAKELIDNGKFKQSISPSFMGFDNKMSVLKALMDLHFNYNKSPKRDATELKKSMMQINGVGKETADTILLYGYDVPLIIVDNYLRIIAMRHNWIENRKISYKEFSSRLNALGLFNSSRNCKVFHARIDDIAKQWCDSKSPKCEGCPLRGILV